VEIAMEVCEEFGAFLQSTGNFLDPLAIDDKGHIDPVVLWVFHGGDDIHM